VTNYYLTAKHIAGKHALRCLPNPRDIVLLVLIAMLFNALAPVAFAALPQMCLLWRLRARYPFERKLAYICTK